MFWYIVCFVAGGLVAWQFPQPSWAKKATDEIKAKFNDFFADDEDTKDSKND